MVIIYNANQNVLLPGCYDGASDTASELPFDKSTVPWETSARRLWSLWDMIQYSCANICEMYRGLIVAIEGLHRSADPQAELHDSFKASLADSVLPPVLREVHDLKLDMKLHFRIHRLHSQLISGEHFTAAGLARDFELLRDDIIVELSSQKFAFIPPPNDKYFGKEKLFGEEVHNVFPDARDDIRDAGDCLAASLPTASVFHLMRAAEHGLRALARKLRVTLTHKGKQCPIEFGDWDTVITAIKNKIIAARKLPAGLKKQANLGAYSNAADHCEYMKDIWRNNASHTRKPYKDAEAVNALERVRDFMQFLGSYLAK